MSVVVGAHTHAFDARSQACTICGSTKEAIVTGRDKPATWRDLDAHYERGFKNGYASATAYWRHKRRRVTFLHGARWALRRFGQYE